MATKQPADSRTKIREIAKERIAFMRTNLDNLESQLAKGADWDRCTAMLGNVRGLQDAAINLQRLTEGLRHLSTPKEGR